jgi:Flp pilus assembly protein TadD
MVQQVPPTPAPAIADSPKVPPARAGSEPAHLGRSDAENRFAAALELMRGQHYEQARVLLTAMTRDYPDLIGPYLNLGIALERLGRTSEAEQAFRSALERKPDEALAYNQLGILYREEGRFAEARRAYERALEIDASYAQAHLNLGILLDLYLQQPEGALEHYQRYRELAGDTQGTVEKWVTDLKRRISERAAHGGTGS